MAAVSPSYIEGTSGQSKGFRKLIVSLISLLGSFVFFAESFANFAVKDFDFAAI